MLRLRIDLSAFETKPREIFWRLERDGIFQKTIKKYATHLLLQYGIMGVCPVTYLEGTFLPDSESPLIFRDGDLLRILPGKEQEAHAADNDGRDPKISNDVTYNGTFTVENSDQLQGNEHATNGSKQETATIECATESAEDTEVLDVTDLSEVSAQLPKKRKRGKRQSRIRSKRVSFDVLDDGNCRGDSIPHMESTPFRRKVSNDIIDEAPNGSSVEGRSEAYLTAIETPSGISKQSKTPMKAVSARKEKKLHAGVGYYLGLLSSGDNSLIAGSPGSSGAPPASHHLEPGPSNFGDRQCVDRSQSDASERVKRDGSLLSTLTPDVVVSCDLGMFNVETSGVERYSDVTLQILTTDLKKKSFFVRHVDGHLPTRIMGSEFKVDWGMMSSVKIL